jgi:hypothetical protein
MDILLGLTFSLVPRNKTADERPHSQRSPLLKEGEMKTSRFAPGSRIGLRRETFAVQNALLILVVAAFPQRSAAQVRVTISPTLVTLATLATQQFKATVSGTANTAVTWEVNGVAGGNSSVGLISTNGLYLGPATVPCPVSLSVIAVSQADPEVCLRHGHGSVGIAVRSHLLRCDHW